jgi:hypothetical protein
MTSLICPNCKGNGFNKLNFEAEESIKQCKVCYSSGELDENKHYRQSWDGESFNGIKSKNVYFGPPLDPESFPGYKIHGE